MSFLPVLISIQERFLNQIKAGEKKWEFRKSCPTRPVTHFLFYNTGTSTLEAFSEIGEIITDLPKIVAEKTAGEAGVSQGSLLRYYGERKKANALQISGFTLFSPPMSKEQILKLDSNFRAPQGHLYLDHTGDFFKNVQRQIERMS